MRYIDMMTEYEHQSPGTKHAIEYRRQSPGTLFSFWFFTPVCLISANLCYLIYPLYLYIKKLFQLFCCRQDCQVRQDPRQGGRQGGPQVRRSQGEQRIR